MAAGAGDGPDGDADRTTGRALEAEARTLHRALDYAGSIKVYERAHAAYRREGDLLSAARAARTLGWFHGSVYGDWAVYGGWVGRAISLLKQAGEDTHEHGWVLLAQAQGGDDLETQRQLYTRAVETARRCADGDLECEALACLGMMLVFSGVVRDGMAHLDEALAAICADEVHDLSVVEGVFCGLFHACERTNDVGRAEQWLRAADDVVQRRSFRAVGGYCRAYYGGILTAAGRWPEAEAELTAALRVFPAEHAQVRGTVLCRLADLRLHQGRVDEAAALLAGLEQHDDAVRPLAVLHLLRGDPDLARDLLERALARGSEDVAEARLLALVVDVELAVGATEAAAVAVERLSTLAGNASTPYLTAVAALARGRLCVATGDGDARSCLDTALRSFGQARLPVDVARVQLELARVLAPTAPAVAVAQAAAALESFRRLSASRDADAAAALLRSLGAPPSTGGRGSADLTRREEEVLALVGHGLTNAEIGERLFISPKTVEHHVGRILAKLGLPSRARAVAHAAARSGDRNLGS